MLGKFSLDTMMHHGGKSARGKSAGGKSAGFFLILYLFTMIVMIMNFFVAILNDFLVAVRVAGWDVVLGLRCWWCCGCRICRWSRVCYWCRSTWRIQWLFLVAVATSHQMQNRDFEVMDHFVDTVKQMIVSSPENGAAGKRNATGRQLCFANAWLHHGALYYIPGCTTLS